MIHYPLPLLGFCAFSGTGKTTLLAKLLPLLKSHGLRIGIVKHAHHQFQVDYPGKDSFRLREAGSDQILIVSRRRMAWMKELGDNREEPTLRQALSVMAPDTLDLILVEGFKHEPFPKIELHRPSLGKPLLFPRDPDIIAIASDDKLPTPPHRLPMLDLNRPQDIADFILNSVIAEPRAEAK